MGTGGADTLDDSVLALELSVFSIEMNLSSRGVSTAPPTVVGA
jgi:hypothetical protein